MVKIIVRKAKAAINHKWKETDLSIQMNSLIWGVAPRAAMFCRDVTKREVSSLFSMVAVWLRWLRLADQNQLVLASPPSARTMDGWARGHARQAFRRRPAPLSPSSRSSLSFPWRLNRTCASLWRQPLALVMIVVVVVCLFVEAPPFPSDRLSACGLRPLARHVPCLSSTLRVLSVFVCVSSEDERLSGGVWSTEIPRYLRSDVYGVCSRY